jgi:ribosomal protein L16 Arg81 hydroxylase
MSSFLTLDEEVFRSQFPEKPFLVRHSLKEHPLFQLSRLIELARSLPEDKVEYNAGDVDVNQDPDKTPRTGLSVEETIKRIEEANSWMVLKYVDIDPEYHDLLTQCMDEVGELSESITPGMHQLESFIFVTSPNSTTPYHMDPEHNFLLQIRGEKQFHVWDPANREVLSEEEIEAFYVGSKHRNMGYREEYTQHDTMYALKPGDGLHVPITAPHWVHVPDNVSISFSVTFRSEWSDRRSRLYQANAQQRKKGRIPAPIGQSAIRDKAKDTLFRLRRKAGSILGR